MLLLIFQRKTKLQKQCSKLNPPDKISDCFCLPVVDLAGMAPREGHSFYCPR